MLGVVLALSGFALTLLTTLVGTVWYASSTITALRKDVAGLGKDVDKIASLFPPAVTRIAVLEQRATSTDKFRAVSQSRHDFGEKP